MAATDQDLAAVAADLGEEDAVDLMVHRREAVLMDRLAVADLMDHPDLIAADLVAAADVVDLTVRLPDEAAVVDLMDRLDLIVVDSVAEADVEVGEAAAVLMDRPDLTADLMADLEAVVGVEVVLEVIINHYFDK